MRLSRTAKESRIIELYMSGRTYRQLQKRYHYSPNHIAELVKGIEVTCAACGKPKGKVHFHAHHPDRINRPNYTIPLCPSCHAKEEARLRREKENKSQSPISGALSITENIVSKPITSSLSFPRGPLSSTEEKVIIGVVIAMLAEALFPGFFERRWQEIQDHWRKS